MREGTRWRLCCPDAFIALYPFLSKVVVPRGVTDLAKDQPPADVVLIATKASLVVRKDLHPALQYLLLNVAGKIHSGPSIFNRPNAIGDQGALKVFGTGHKAKFNWDRV